MAKKVQIQLLDEQTGAVIDDANPVTTADLVKFDDGQTFQQKYDAGLLKGQKGDPGAKGDTGATGAKGDTGAAGADGATWLTGTAAPTSAQGKNGDWYLNTANCDVYQKASGAWSKKGNIKGATGAKGDQGVPGAKGDKGDKGDPGDTVKVGTSTSTAVQRRIFFKVIG